MTSPHLLLTDKPAIAPPVFVFQKDKAQKVSFSILFKYVLRLKPYFMILPTLFLLIFSLDCILEKLILQFRVVELKSFTISRTVNKAS